MTIVARCSETRRITRLSSHARYKTKAAHSRASSNGNIRKGEQIQKNLGKLSTSLQDVEKEWNTLYDHIKKAYNKASDVDQKQTHLKNIFEQITQIEEQNEKRPKIRKTVVKDAVEQ